MIHAGHGRIAVQPSDLKPGEQQRPSGLIVHEEHHEELKRGIVLDIGLHVPEEDFLTIGDTVFYTHGVRVEDVEIVHFDYVYGFIPDDEAPRP